MLHCRVHYFTDGAVIGSKEFVNEAFACARERFGVKRKDGARTMKVSGSGAKGMLWSMRDLRTNAYQSTNLILTDSVFQLIWSGLPAFVRGQASLAGSINLLAALAQAQGTPLTGITLDKDRLKLSLVSRILIVAGAAGSFAFEAGNQTVSAKFDVKEGALKNLRESLLDDAAQLIHDEAEKLVTANPAKMLEFNLTPAMLTDLQSAITAYSETLGTPRAAISGRTGITAAIAAEIERADANLENLLDRLILQFAAANPEFTTAYASARKVIDAGGGRATPPAPVPAPPAP